MRGRVRNLHATRPPVHMPCPGLRSWRVVDSELGRADEPGRTKGDEVMAANEMSNETANELVVDLGDAAEVTRGSGGSGSDDKRYIYN